MATFYNPNDKMIYNVVNDTWNNTGVKFEDEEYMLICAGQSNCQSANEGPLLAQERNEHPKHKQYCRGIKNANEQRPKQMAKNVPITNYVVKNLGDIIPLMDPVQHRFIAHHESVGFVKSFCNEFSKNHPNATITVMPCALGGTGFRKDANFCWDKNVNSSNNLYYQMISECNSVLAKNSKMKILAILWHQGENDSGMVEYPNKLDELVRSMRKDLLNENVQKLRNNNDNALRTPFICGTLLKSWRDTNYNMTEIVHQAHVNIKYRFNDGITDCCNFDRLTGVNYFDGMNVHFDADSQRKMGVMYYNKFSELKR